MDFPDNSNGKHDCNRKFNSLDIIIFYARVSKAVFSATALTLKHPLLHAEVPENTFWRNSPTSLMLHSTLT